MRFKHVDWLSGFASACI